MGIGWQANRGWCSKHQDLIVGALVGTAIGAIWIGMRWPEAILSTAVLVTLLAWVAACRRGE